MRTPAMAVAGLLAATLLAPVEPAQARPYRWVDQRGNVHYADSPPHPAPAGLEDLDPAARYHPAPAPSREAPATGPSQSPAGPGRASTRRAPPAASPPAAVASPVGPGRPAPAGRRPLTRPTPMSPEPTARGRPQWPPVPRAANASAQELLVLSGIRDDLDTLAAEARLEFSRRRWGLTRPERAWTAISRGFRTDALASTARRAISEALTPAELDALLTWARSPLARRARQLRMNTVSAANRQAYRDFVSGLVDAPPPPERMSLILWIERHGQMAKFQTEVLHALRASVQRLLAPFSTRARAEIEQDSNGRLDAEEEAARFSVVTFLLFAYRELSAEELDELATFWRSPPGVHLRQLGRDCLRRALRAAEQEAEAALRSQALSAVAP